MKLAQDRHQRVSGLLNFFKPLTHIPPAISRRGGRNQGYSTRGGGDNSQRRDRERDRRYEDQPPPPRYRQERQPPPLPMETHMPEPVTVGPPPPVPTFGGEIPFPYPGFR